MPVYDFTNHCRADTVQRVRPAEVILFEGILVLHIPEVLSRCNMKARRCRSAPPRPRSPGVKHTAPQFAVALHPAPRARQLVPVSRAHTPAPRAAVSARTACAQIFVDTDDDLRLSRRILRDTEHRGRSLRGVIQQYTRFVKPSHDRFVSPSRRVADVIVPWHECASPRCAIGGAACVRCSPCSALALRARLAARAQCVKCSAPPASRRPLPALALGSKSSGQRAVRLFVPCLVSPLPRRRARLAPSRSSTTAQRQPHISRARAAAST